MKEIDKIIAMAQERQNRHMKFGRNPPPAVTLIMDACKQMIHKNFAAAYECMQCALDELSEETDNEHKNRMY